MRRGSVQPDGGRAQIISTAGRSCSQTAPTDAMTEWPAQRSSPPKI
jgi:hypothetical protein